MAAKPGCGVLMHTHDTVETFILMHGKWKPERELDCGTEAVTLEAPDVIACPIEVQRRFEWVAAGAGRQDGLLLRV